MASWHNTYPVFPPIATRVGVGREFKTDIEETVGDEYRTEIWEDGRWRFNLSNLKLSRSQMDEWIAFTSVLKGAAGLCLYRPKSTMFELSAETIGTGDGAETDFQLQKARSYQGFAGETEIVKFPWHDYPPLTYAGGAVALPTEYVRVFLDGTEKTLTTHFTVNRNTGVITFLSAPGNGVVVTATCKYMVLCRFEGDYNPIESESGISFEIASGVNLIEPKGAN